MFDFIVSKYIKNKDNINDAAIRQLYGKLSGVFGIFCNLVLFVLKLIAGFITGAVSVLADAFNNLSDAASSIVTLVGFHMAGKPADSEHPFGHGRIEYISGMFISFVIIIMGYELLKSSVTKIIHPQAIEFNLLSVFILVFAILLKLWMAYANNKLSKKISSETIKATVIDSLSDCVSTAAVLVGMFLYKWLGWNLDGYLGLVVAILIIIAGIKTIKDTVGPLLGAVPDKEIVDTIYKIVGEENKIIGTHDMIIHDYGPGRRMVSLHAEVAHNIDILEAHDMIDNVEKMIEEKLHYEATIHMDPVIVNDDEIKSAREMVEDIVYKLNPLWKIHDFRMVRGITHTNLLFDLVVSPKEMSKAKEIEKNIKDKINKYNSHFFAVVKVEQGYV